MNLKISSNTALIMKSLMGELMLYDCNDIGACKIFLIRDFKIEKKEVKYGLLNKRTKTELFLTECTMLSYNNKADFIGINVDEVVEHIIKWNDLYDLREAWIKLNKGYEKMTEYAEKLNLEKINAK